jgi:hypothetical protein
VTKRIASTIHSLFQNRTQLIHAVIPSGNSRAARVRIDERREVT